MTTALPRKSAPTLDVSIVSANPETADGLQSYLGGAGVRCHCLRAIAGLEKHVPARAAAAVIFPDDYEAPAFLATFRHLRRVRPRLFAVIVTREPGRFVEVAKSDGRSLPAVVLPKPSFGWEILDALRAHADAALV
jgi:hypothetical protein